MRYRAELVGVPNLVRPVQNFSDHLHVVRRWAGLTLGMGEYAAHRGVARVEIWEVTEKLTGTVAYEPPPPEPTVVAPAAAPALAKETVA